MNLCAAIILAVFRMVVIPVQFEDREFSCTADELKQTVTLSEEYFRRQFRGERDFSFTLAPTVTLPKAVAYYGSNYSDRRDVLLHEAVRSACSSSSGSIDFSLYDNDSDGYVDNVCLITAGLSEADGADESWIWPQHGYLKDHGGALSIGGVQVNGFTVCTEQISDAGASPRTAGIGIFCHEFAHVLGLYDLYDTDGEGSGGLSKGLWGLSLMDTGCRLNDASNPPDFNAVDMDLLGLGECKSLAKGSYTLEPLENGERYLKAETDSEGEYYLIECREGRGLAIYHIDRSAGSAGWSDYYKTELTAAERWERDQVNCRPDRECARLVAADPDAADASGVFFPQKGHDSFGSDTSPACRFWSGASPSLAITDIVRSADGSVSFNVIEPLTLDETTVFQDAAIINWKPDATLKDISSCEIEWSGGDEECSATVDGDATSYTVTGLKPQTAYKYKVRLRLSDGCAYSAGASFVTKVQLQNSYPYIYLKGSDRNSDGTFNAWAKLALRVFNATDAAEVKWYFNGREISVGADGYWRVTSSGTLKAVVLMNDGSTEVLIKEIQL